MKGFDLVITLESDCIFSERNATEGAHVALDYIPGGALLGAVGAKLYQADDVQAAFDWFHSGKLRFSNAYPLSSNGQRTYPIPSCWHEAKNESATELGKVDSDKVWRLDKVNKLPDNKQPKQMREGYVAESGYLAELKKQLKMMTSIDRTTGRAKTGSLFGYDSLSAGQRFYAQVRLDDAIGAEAQKVIEQVFKQPLLLGRSRSAGYGRVSAQVLNNVQQLDAAKASLEKKITLWLQSDLMVLDQYGQPTLSPTTDDLGLPSGKLVANNSFIRTRRYSSWNVYKHGYEMERQVICKGGVLVYELDEPLDAQQLQILEDKLASGIGMERQAGLGQVWLNPPLLDSENPKFKPQLASIGSESEAANKTCKKSALITWLESRKGSASTRQKSADGARKLAKEYLGMLSSVRQLKGLDGSFHVGPSSSQWSELQTLLKANDSIESIANRESGSFKAGGDGWSHEFQGEDTKIISIHAWLKQLMLERNDRYFLGQLIREIMSELKLGKGGQS